MLTHMTGLTGQAQHVVLFRCPVPYLYPRKLYTHQ